MRYADLHLHSHYSDGADAPADVVARAKVLGIDAIALTDHDTTAGLAEGRAVAVNAGIEWVDGVEISAVLQRQEVHVLGLGIDPENEILANALTRLGQKRESRGHDILGRLAECGIHLDEVLLQEEVGGKAVSRMHIARALKRTGVTRSAQEGFDRFLNPGRPAYLPKALLPLEETLDAIHAAGGLAFVAHPALSKSSRRILPVLLAYPFDGIEAYHTRHSAGRTEELVALAQERKLLITGGSDCHGAMKGQPEMGKVKLPWKDYEILKSAF
ncbi:MAG: PHP domain-containing protein [Candidatus Hydrogenedentes bacterium]|nr:PHP domain-containing protein [Candidatus Hydrogenedentota bacterium]